MIISVAEARELMGQDVARKYTDSEVEELISVLSAIANLAIDSYIGMKQKQRQKGGEK